jgi:beta-glucosidase
MNRLPLIVLLACGAAPAQAQTGELPILPAPAAAWRITVGHWESQVELTGNAVQVPRPSAEYARASQLGAAASGTAGRREGVTLDWKDLWLAHLRFESLEPLDLRPWLGGTLAFDLNVERLDQGNVKVKVGCGDGCGRNVNLLETARALAGKGWQPVSLAMSCFVREGADFSRVTQPFAVEGNGSGRISVANVRLVPDGKPNTSCPDYRTESVTAAMQNESWAVSWWLPRHQQKQAEARRLLAEGNSPQVVFIGDSITEGWEKDGAELWRRHYAPHHALNLGFGGDRTENLLWRLQNGALDGLAPKAVVLMIGTNNTGHRAENPEAVAAGVQRIVEEIRRRLPDSKLLLLAIFPRGERADDFLRGLNDRVNQRLAGLADGRTVHYLDINPRLTNPDGSLSKDVMPDFLHPNGKGYAIWQQAMDPVLKALLSR